MRKFHEGWLKQFLISLLLMVLCGGSTFVYGFERGPIIWSPGFLPYDINAPGHSTDPYVGACEYWASKRDVEYVGIPTSQHADIKKMWVKYRNEDGSFTDTAIPTTHFRCGAVIHYFATPNPYDYEKHFGGAYPICYYGGTSWQYASSDTICTIPDNIPDPGANVGKPDPELCISNPINAATGNKYTEEIDISLSNGLIFSRHHNSDGLSGKTQIGLAWRHSYQRNLYINPEIVTATRKDGRLAYFRLVDTSWINQQSTGEVLISTVDENGNITGWQLTSPTNSTEHYNASGKLLALNHRNGRTQTLSYDANDRLISVSDDVGRTLGFTYDGSSRIETMTDPAGSLYHYDYDTTGNLVSVTYPDSRTRTYHYNESAYTSNTNLPNALTGITDENGVRYATYHYDTQGRAIITEHAGGADRHELQYSDDGSSTVVIDPLGSEYTRQFETILGVAKNVGQSQPAGAGCSAASSNTTYDVNGNVASRTDFNGNKTCYAFDLDRNLEIAQLEGLAEGVACPDVVNYTPAANTDERKTLTEWHFDLRLPVRITELERETSLDYDGYGNITRLNSRDLVSNDTRTWVTSYTYHPIIPGVIVQRIEDGPRTDVSDITTIDYYAPDENCLGGHFGCRSQVSRATNALGHITEITRYNAHGQPEEIIAPNGLRTTLVYDVRQRLITRTSGTETTRYDYNGVGQLIRITSPDNSTLTYTYDDAHRLVGVQDTLGNAIHYTLDAMGNRTEQRVLDAAGQLVQTQQQEFDALSRLWKMIGAQNQTTELAYDANGNLKQATNPLQQSASNSFDALNRLIQSTDAMGGQTSQQHDALDQLAKVTDPKGIDTTYTSNALGDVLQEVSADRGTTNYTYDAAGNLITRTDARGVVQSITYDALNRPTTQSYTTVANVPPTAPTTWRYDEGSNNIGRLTSMRDDAGSTTYQYDLQGRLLNKNQSVLYGNESFVHALSYHYDNSGRLSQTIYPSGAKINTVYDANGRPAEIHVNGKVLLQNITYHPFGAPKSWVWGNGQPHSRSFDLDGRLVEHPLGADTQTLTYDAASRIIATNQTDPVYNRWYDYDTLDRLTRQSDNVSTRLWGYDANSNRTHVQSGATTYPYTLDPTSNRLLLVTGPEIKTYTYDAAGNPLTDGVADYTWNAAGRLTKTMARSKVSDHLYNGLGERLLKIGSRSTRGGPYLYVYNTAGQLIGDYEKAKGAKQATNWVQQQETVWLGDIPVAVIKQPVATEPAQVYFIHADHLNTPRLIVDQTNTTIWRWNNKNAFGNNPPDEDPDGDRKRFKYNLRFAGQYFDTETNLHYNYFRDYEPVTGRYLSSDPVGLDEHVQIWLALSTAQHQTQLRYQLITLGDMTGLSLLNSTPLPLELNPYNYVASNPLRWTDLTGESIDNFGSFGDSSIISGLQCSDNDRKKKNCAALRDNIINQTCKSISNGKARMACFAAAWATYLACLAED